jgi:hypothetical protein
MAIALLPLLYVIVWVIVPQIPLPSHPASSPATLRAAERAPLCCPAGHFLVTGHDFTACRKSHALCQGTTSQTAEKLPLQPANSCFVTGHDFSRAENAAK